MTTESDDAPQRDDALNPNIERSALIPDDFSDDQAEAVDLIVDALLAAGVNLAAGNSKKLKLEHERAGRPQRRHGRHRRREREGKRGRVEIIMDARTATRDTEEAAAVGILFIWVMLRQQACIANL